LSPDQNSANLESWTVLIRLFVLHGPGDPVCSDIVHLVRHPEGRRNPSPQLMFIDKRVSSSEPATNHSRVNGAGSSIPKTKRPQNVHQKMTIIAFPI
jgi:hypothetical protein